VVPGAELHEVLGSMLREAPERASHRAPVKPAYPWIDDVGRWRESFRLRWRDAEASNILETRMLMYTIQHVARAHHFHENRILLFTDNLAALSVVSRGRSSARALRFVCRVVAAYTLGCGIKLMLRWVQSRRNHADGPSRQKKIGYYSGTCSERPPRGDAGADRKRNYHG